MSTDVLADLQISSIWSPELLTAAIEEITSLRARLAEAEREIAEYEAGNRDLVKRSDYWKGEAERLTRDRDRYASDAGERAGKLDEAEAVIAVQSTAVGSYVRDNAKLAEENEGLREALAFYRDGFRYHPKRSKTGIDLSEWKPTTELLEDCGERAIAVIGERDAPN